MKVAFLGLGAMGLPMTVNLARAGHTVTAWNRTPRDFTVLEQAGATLCQDIAEAVAASEVVCLCLLDDAAVRSVFQAILPHLSPGCIVVDHSTDSVATARDLAQAAAGHGVRFLDAPVSGGAAGAAAGTLTVMVGGEKEAFDAMAPVLSSVGALIRYMGPSGSGQSTKLINQLLTAVHQATAVEALHLADQAGLDLSALQEVLDRSYGASRMVSRSVPVVSSRQFDSPFTIDILTKDMKLVQQLARTFGARLPLTEAALLRYEAAQRSGLGNQDGAVLIKLLED